MRHVLMFAVTHLLMRQEGGLVVHFRVRHRHKYIFSPSLLPLVLAGEIFSYKNNERFTRGKAAVPPSVFWTACAAIPNFP